jgi:hypothetical protein
VTRTFLVETMGLEPTTPCLQSRCSRQLSYVPGEERGYRARSVRDRRAFEDGGAYAAAGELAEENDGSLRGRQAEDAGGW